MHPDARLADFGSRHHGVASRAELLAHGLPAKWIDRRVASGHLQPCFRGVYLIGHAALTTRGRYRAALLAAGPGARLSHHAVAGVLGVMEPRPGPVDVTRARRARPQAGLALHHAQLPREDCWDRDGWLLTSPARMLLDLAETELAATVTRAYNEAQVLKLVTRRQVLDALPRWAGRRGLAVLRALAGDDVGTTRSVLEDMFLPLVRHARLPLPKVNRWVEGVFADAVWERERVVVELDSRTYHDTDPRFESDRAKGNRLIARGWLVLRFTYRRLKREPLACIAELAAALSARAVAPQGRRAA